MAGTFIDDLYLYFFHGFDDAERVERIKERINLLMARELARKIVAGEVELDELDLTEDPDDDFIDPSGVILSPGMPNGCKGNGKFVDAKTGEAIECCCDNCDYFLICYPEYYNSK